MSDALSLGLQHHRQGRLAEAAALYQQVLAAQPDHPAALHLLGAVALQCGEPARAAELIGRAVALEPGNAAYHANLAEAYRGLGQLDRAAEACRTALRLQPSSSEAANNLGLVLLAQGHQPEAVAQFRTALRVQPDNGMACNNLGNALRLGGDLDGALAHFRRAVEIDPNLAEARSNLGQLLLERHQADEALTHLRVAVRLRPDFAEARNNLGNALRELGRLAEARQSYAEALRINPNLALTYNNMGQALQEEQALDDALAWYRRALQLDPHSARILCNIASVLVEQEKYDDALTLYRGALKLDPAHPEAHLRLGALRHEQGQFEAAQGHYRDALKHAPHLATAHAKLGTVREELGDFADAERCWRTALAHDPYNDAALGHLATMLRGKLPAADEQRLRERLAAPNLTDARRAGLSFALAQVADARSNYTEAADLLRRANALALTLAQQRGQEYDPAEHERFVTRMLATCSAEFFARTRGFGLDSERPIFIFGLPRSGTTLTEQILASHSRIFGAGELRLSHDDLDMLAGPEADSLTALSALDCAGACRIAERHLQRLHELNADRPHVADKMPDNYLYLGLLAVLFPRARFIHCRRDLRDIAVSCWMTNFRHIRWANDPDHIATRFDEYRRLMAHWRQVQPVPLLEVDYEETVADLEGTARRLVEWCGLAWEPACLRFYEGTRPVRTASVAQVRQPIYQRSAGRWRHYQPALGPLFARLQATACT